MALTPLNLPPNCRVEKDEIFDNTFSRNKLVVPSLFTSNSQPLPDGQIIFNKANGLLYYSTDGVWKNLDSSGGVSLSITTGEQNIQLGGMGDINGPPSLFYFGTQLGPTSLSPPIATLIPWTDVYNHSKFIQDTTSSAGGPSYSMGAPGWKVPISGKYEISVTTTVGGNLDGVNNPASSGFLGVGSPLNVSIAVAKNNFGSLNISVASVTHVWSAPPLGTDSIYVPLSGSIILNITKNDVLYVGLNVQNKNVAVSLINATMSIKLLFAS